MSVPHFFFLELPLESLDLLWHEANPGTLFVLVWWGFLFGVAPGPKIPLSVLPKISWWWWPCSSGVPWWWSGSRRLAMNSATGGKVPLPDGWGAMLKPFISRRSFCRFFFPPTPRDNSVTQPATRAERGRNRRMAHREQNSRQAGIQLWRAAIYWGGWCFSGFVIKSFLRLIRIRNSSFLQD